MIDLLKRNQHNSEPSLHDISMIGMPSNAGKKPGRYKRKRKRKSASQDENRVPTNSRKQTLPEDSLTSEPNVLPPDIPMPPLVPRSISSSPPLSCVNDFLLSPVYPHSADVYQLSLPPPL